MNNSSFGWTLVFRLPGHLSDDVVLGADSVVMENRQLRRERDFLMEKLVRSKSALKDTLDRLADKREKPDDTSCRQ